MSRETVKTALKNIDKYWAKDALAQIEQDEQTINSLYNTINEQHITIEELKQEIANLKANYNI